MVEDDTDCAHDDTHTKQYARTHATCVFLPGTVVLAKAPPIKRLSYYPYSSLVLGCMESCGPVWISHIAVEGAEEPKTCGEE